MTRLMRRVVVAAGVAVTLALAGCAQSSPTDSSFEEAIPAALESADLGVTDAWAGTTLDGFTTVLSVGGTLAAGQLSEDELRQIIRIVVDENTIDAGQLDLSLRDEARESVDLIPLLESLGADPTGNGRIDYDAAVSIAEEAPR